MADASGAAGATRHDDELLGIAREHIGSAYGLSAAQSSRLRGATRAEIETDAKQMRAELGLEPLDEHDGHGDRSRDAGGRFAKSGGGSEINQAIRQAAGRTS
jgi:hypothetical protein